MVRIQPPPPKPDNWRLASPMSSARRISGYARALWALTWNNVPSLLINPAVGSMIPASSAAQVRVLAWLASGSRRGQLRTSSASPSNAASIHPNASTNRTRCVSGSLPRRRLVTSRTMRWSTPPGRSIAGALALRATELSHTLLILLSHDPLAMLYFTPRAPPTASPSGPPAAGCTRPAKCISSPAWCISFWECCAIGPPTETVRHGARARPPQDPICVHLCSSVVPCLLTVRDQKNHGTTHEHR